MLHVRYSLLPYQELRKENTINGKLLLTADLFLFADFCGTL